MREAMTEFTQFTLDGSLAVTVAAPATSTTTGLSPAGRHDKSGKVAEPAAQTLREALRPVTAAAQEVIEGFRALPGRPEEIEIVFGVNLDATFGAVFATAAVGTHLEVTLRWTASRPPGMGSRDDSAPGTGASAAPGPRHQGHDSGTSAAAPQVGTTESASSR
jgi:hypothetical protein